MLDILPQATFVHRFNVAETNENDTMAVLFVADWAGFSNDFSIKIGGA